MYDQYTSQNNSKKTIAMVSEFPRSI